MSLREVTPEQAGRGQLATEQRNIMIENLRLTTLAERPELTGRAEALKGSWPEFMTHEPIGERFYIDAARHYAEFTLVAFSADAPDRVLARAHSIPVGLADVPPDGLPDTGWDGMVRQAHLTRLAGYRGDAVCGLEIMVRPELRGSGLGTRMLREAHANARDKGFRHFIAPVRPPGKADAPHVSMSDYVARSTEAGLPADPLLRAHVKLGSDIVGIAPASMVVPGSVDQWRQWTGLPFDESGPVIVPDALTPVHCDLLNDFAVYVEPNVWVYQRLS
ncbi:GNAT family N-acetyltransferase [Streptomyces parvus]